jgi:hypothetical protein
LEQVYHFLRHHEVLIRQKYNHTTWNPNARTTAILVYNLNGNITNKLGLHSSEQRANAFSDFTCP